MLLPLELLLIGRCVKLVVKTRLLTLLLHLGLIWCCVLLTLLYLNDIGGSRTW